MFYTFCSICFSLSHEKKQSFFNFKFPRIRKFQIKLGWDSGPRLYGLTQQPHSKIKSTFLLLNFSSFSVHVTIFSRLELIKGIWVCVRRLMMVNVCFNISIQYQIFVTSSFPIPLSVYALPMTAFTKQMAIKTSAFCFVLPIVCVVQKIIFFWAP